MFQPITQIWTAKLKTSERLSGRLILNVLLCLLFLSWSITPSLAEVNHLPADLEVEMLTDLLSERSEINDKVEVKLLEPINLPHDRIFIPINSVILGRVVEVQESGRALRKGKVKVVFERVYFPNGYVLFTEGFLMGANRKLQKAKNNATSQDDYQQTVSEEEAKNNTVKGKLTFRDKLLAVGKVGVGALIGGPVGAAAAAGTLVFEKGGKVRIKTGDHIFIHLERVAIMSQELDVRGEINNPPAVSPQPRY